MCRFGFGFPDQRHKVFLGLLVALLGGILLFDVVQRARNGPKP